MLGQARMSSKTANDFHNFTSVLHLKKSNELHKFIICLIINKDTLEDDSLTIFTALASNPCSKDSAKLVWNFIKKNFKKIVEKFGNDELLGELIEVFNSLYLIITLNYGYVLRILSRS